MEKTSLSELERALKQRNSGASVHVRYDTIAELVHDVRVARDLIAILLDNESLQSEQVKSGFRKEICRTALAKFKLGL